MGSETDSEVAGKVSRRELLKHTGVAVGGAAIAPLYWSAARFQPQTDTGPFSLAGEAYATLDAVCARLIPADANGGGAREAQVARFIDRGLGGALAGSLDAYRSGLTALGSYAEASRGATFAELPPPDQDSVLIDVESGEVPGFTGGSEGFFNMVRSHTIQGMFSDPFYGGNADFIGWDLIGYPGVRVSVPAEYQQLDGPHPPNHRSAYDFSLFEEGEI